MFNLYAASLYFFSTSPRLARVSVSIIFVVFKKKMMRKIYVVEVVYKGGMPPKDVNLSPLNK